MNGPQVPNSYDPSFSGRPPLRSCDLWPLDRRPLPLSMMHIGIQEMERYCRNTISALRNFTELGFLSVMSREYLNLCLKVGFSFSRLTIYVIYSSNHDAFESKMRAINTLWWDNSSKPGVSQANWDMWLPCLLVTGTVGSATIPTSFVASNFVASKWSQKRIKVCIQLSATYLFKVLTKIPTKNGTDFGKI